MANLAGTPADLIDCPDCGTLQRIPARWGWTVLLCKRCTGVLERTNLRSFDASLALSIAALLLMVPSLSLTFLTTSISGATRSSLLGSSAVAMIEDGWPVLGIIIFLFTVIAPLLRYSLLSLVLGLLRLDAHPHWLGRAFRFANALQTWAMTDVYLLGLAVAYMRLKASLNVQMGAGAKCLIVVGVLSLFIRAVLDKEEVWRAIGLGRAARSGRGEPANAMPLANGNSPITCLGCDLVVIASSEGHNCPRCDKTLHRRKPDSIARAVALTTAGILLYIPANVYPIATLPIGFSSVKYTVIEGVIDLAKARLWGLALLVLTASFAIPLLKLVGLAWCLVSVAARSVWRLPLKTRVFRGIEEIGRWSMIDPFVISCFVPVTHYNALIYGRAEPAAPAFTAVVILTIIATKCFDPRLMWDVKGKAS
jgi:paraquat-inducible protein A